MTGVGVVAAGGLGTHSEQSGHFQGPLILPPADGLQSL
jgi:hypothetical protein